jgi:hypothetical protein
MSWFGKFYKNNKAMVWAAAIAVILSLGVLFKVKDEVTRFTLIMPLFAGFILFSILMTPDEELEDKPVSRETPASKKSSKR